LNELVIAGVDPSVTQYLYLQVNKSPFTVFSEKYQWTYEHFCVCYSQLTNIRLVLWITVKITTGSMLVPV